MSIIRLLVEAAAAGALCGLVVAALWAAASALTGGAIPLPAPGAIGGLTGAGAVGCAIAALVVLVAALSGP